MIKIDRELEKAGRKPPNGRQRSGSWKNRNRRKKTASRIVQAVRSLKLTPAELMAFLNDPANHFAASVKWPEAGNIHKEDNAHEEN